MFALVPGRPRLLRGAALLFWRPCLLVMRGCGSERKRPREAEYRPRAGRERRGAGVVVVGSAGAQERMC